MTQSELDRSVARATGESVTTVRRLGFLLAHPAEPFPEPDHEDLGPSVLDWDAVDRARYGRQPRECPAVVLS